MCLCLKFPVNFVSTPALEQIQQADETDQGRETLNPSTSEVLTKS